jgi:hypothetical protein
MSRRLRKLINDPKHWRERATAMRAVAARVTDPKVKASTNGAADGYRRRRERRSLVSATHPKIEREGSGHRHSAAFVAPNFFSNVGVGGGSKVFFSSTTGCSISRGTSQSADTVGVRISFYGNLVV